jgi:hypothetical protein
LERTLTRWIYRFIATATIILGACIIPTVASAECGRAAQQHAHTALTAAEKEPLADEASRTAALADLADMPVVNSCPDDPRPLQNAVYASYQVYHAWNDAIRAFVQVATYRASPTTDKRCEQVWIATERDTIAYGYNGAFHRTAPHNTTPDSPHVSAYLRQKAKELGFSLPAPYSFMYAQVPIQLTALNVRAHLPAGSTCY